MTFACGTGCKGDLNSTQRTQLSELPYYYSETLAWSHGQRQGGERHGVGTAGLADLYLSRTPTRTRPGAKNNQYSVDGIPLASAASSTPAPGCKAQPCQCRSRQSFPAARKGAGPVDRVLPEGYHQNPELVSSSIVVGHKLACCPAREPWLFLASTLAGEDCARLLARCIRPAGQAIYQRAHRASFGLYSHILTKTREIWFVKC